MARKLYYPDHPRPIHNALIGEFSTEQKNKVRGSHRYVLLHVLCKFFASWASKD